MPSYKWQVVIFWSSKIIVQAICVVLFIHKHNDDGTAKQLDFFLTASKNKLTVLCFAGSRWNRNVSGREGSDIDVPFTSPIAILFFFMLFSDFLLKPTICCIITVTRVALADHVTYDRINLDQPNNCKQRLISLLVKKSTEILHQHTTKYRFSRFFFFPSFFFTW